jgi:hypothetical protein
LDHLSACRGAGIAAIAGAFTTDLSRLPPPEGPRQGVSLLTLAALDLSGNHFGDGGLLALCRGLTHFLGGMLARRGADTAGGVGGAEAETETETGAAVSPLVCLRVLKLSHNKCGDKAAACLAQLLESFYLPGLLPLEELSLGHNPLGVAGEEEEEVEEEALCVCGRERGCCYCCFICSASCVDRPIIFMYMQLDCGHAYTLVLVLVWCGVM